MSDAGEMTKLTKNLPSKSEKMRVLARAGYSRGDIARYLGTSYQFVRNVLLREEGRSAHARSPGISPAAESQQDDGRKVQLGPGGQITLPAAIQRSMNLREGDVLFVEADDGTVRLLTIHAAVRKAQAIVRQYVPAGVSLVDDLLEDRRREVDGE